MTTKKPPLAPEFASLLPTEQQPAPEIALKLTPEEVDVVLGALGLCQYAVVAELIGKITAQAMPQAELIGRREALADAPVDITLPN